MNTNEKDKIVSILQKNGYRAKNEKGIVTILYDAGTNLDTFIEEIELLFINKEYKSSYCIRCKKEGEQIFQQQNSKEECECDDE